MILLEDAESCSIDVLTQTKLEVNEIIAYIEYQRDLYERGELEKPTEWYANSGYALIKRRAYGKYLAFLISKKQQEAKAARLAHHKLSNDKFIDAARLILEKQTFDEIAAYAGWNESA